MPLDTARQWERRLALAADLIFAAAFGWVTGVLTAVLRGWSVPAP